MADHRIVEDGEAAGTRRPASSKEPARKAQRGNVRGIDLARFIGMEANPFWYDENRKPPDMAYGFKRMTYAGKEDVRHQANVASQGFTPVPKKRHPEIVGEHEAMRDPDGCIVIDGQILMERPQELEDQAVDLLNEAARQRVIRQVNSLGLSKEGTLPRKVTRLRKTYEQPIIPPEQSDEED